MRIEKALRILRTHGKELKREILERRNFTKPSVVRNQKRQATLRRNRKKVAEEQRTQANWKAEDRRLKKLRMSDALDTEK